MNISIFLQPLLLYSTLLLMVTSSFLLIILLKFGKTKIHFVWAMFNLSIFVWSTGLYLANFFKDPSLIHIFLRVSFGAGLFIGVFFFHLSTFFYPTKKPIVRIAYTQAILFLLYNICWGERYLPEAYKLFGVYYYSHLVSFSSLLAATIWVSFILLGFYRLIKAYRSSAGVRRLQLKYLLIGMLIGWGGGLLYIFPFLKIPVFPLGNFTIPLYSIIVTYAILKFRLLDIRIVFTRAGIFVVLYGAILWLPFFVGYKTGSWVYSTSLAVVLATIGPIAYRILRRRAEDLILAEQRRYQKILTQAAEGMSRERDIKRLLKLIVYLVTKTVKIKFALIFLYDEESQYYQLSAIRDHMKFTFGEKLKKDNPLITFLIEKRNPVLFDELPADIKPIVGNEFKNGLIVQSFIGEKLLGFMLLGEKINGKMYSVDDINVFRILSQQSSLAIENCLFLDESKRQQERIFAAEKLASIGGMADGVAHQMRNKLNIFSVVAGTQQFGLEDLLTDHSEYLSAHGDAKALLEELLTGTKAIQDTVKKTADMINGILNFSKSDEKSKMFSEFSLRKVVESATEVIKTKHQIADFNLLQADYGQNENIYGVETQIRECVYNLLDNAYEAIREKIDYHLKGNDREVFVPKITLKLNKKTDKDMLEFVDNGIGIKEEHKRKIFSPFFTTKPSVQSGTGIGMYVVKRMIEENHHGKIRFESQYGQGTRVVIDLPVLGTVST